MCVCLSVCVCVVLDKTPQNEKFLLLGRENFVWVRVKVRVRVRVV